MMSYRIFFSVCIIFAILSLLCIKEINTIFAVDDSTYPFFESVTLSVDPCPKSYFLNKSAGTCELYSQTNDSNNSSVKGTKLIGSKFQSADSMFDKGVNAMKSEIYEEAVHYFDKVLELEPNNPAALSNKGLALDKLERYEEALTSLDKALSIDSNNTNVLFQKGSTLNSLNRSQEATLYFDKVLSIEPNHTKALLSKGNSFLKNNNYEVAILYYDRALAIDPNYTKALSNKGIALLELERYQEAVELFNKLLVIEPSDQETLYLMGFALDKLERHDEAIKYFDKALAIDPNYSKAQETKNKVLARINQNDNENPQASSSSLSLSNNPVQTPLVSDPCPTGYSLSKVTNKCEISPTPPQTDPCPQGYILDKIIGKCITTNSGMKDNTNTNNLNLNNPANLERINLSVNVIPPSDFDGSQEICIKQGSTSVICRSFDVNNGQAQSYLFPLSWPEDTGGMICVELDYESDDKFSSSCTSFDYENDRNIIEEIDFTEDIFDD